MEKEKVNFYLFEFIGTMLVAFSYNFTGEYTYVLLVASIWSWDVSCAHFNSAITVGDLFAQGSIKQSF